ncbi:MAG: type 4a pilus biogenesis protein PilO [Acidobacteria bacterium]|nr:type 4a pilus biogenesis protein PilO [Acidobacteriota bacterium]
MKSWYGRRRWIYWGLALLIAADIAIYIGWLRGLAERIQVDPSTLANLESEVGQRTAEVERLRRVQAQAPTAAPKLDAFARERFWNGAVGYSRTVAELTETAKSAGVRVSGTQYNESQSKERPEMLELRLNASVEGSYANLLRFMQELERSPRFYLVQDLSVGSTRGGQVRVDMTVLTYFRKGAA